MSQYTIGEVFRDKITFTSAQIKLLTTPAELVAAPGAGKLIVPHGFLLVLNYGGTNVFTEAGDNLIIHYDDSGPAVTVTDVIECTNFIDQAADTITRGVLIKDSIDASADIVNKNLAIANNNANFAGNAAGDNTLDVHVWYSIIDV